ncbi:MAG: hypothetical protein CML28_02865 [Rhizobiales bacterium]|nr:hypothetical protein [Hyphomicrobiales bacterium]
MNNPDVVIIGSGMAGVSVSFPLVKAGLKVCMVDIGKNKDYKDFPKQSMYYHRKNNIEYWDHILGKGFEGVSGNANETPKMKVPQHKYVRSGFLKGYNIKPLKINPTGSLAMGGLSNMWGAGLFPYIDQDLEGSVLKYKDLLQSYKDIAKRIGISGSNDCLKEIFGEDIPLMDAIPLHHNSQYLLENYLSRKNTSDSSFILGYNRNAVISADHDGRKACSLDNSCLWHCNNDSIYNARFDLKKLMNYENFEYKADVFVKELKKNGSGYNIISSNNSREIKLFSKRICLAAGTIGSTVIALRSLKLFDAKQKVVCHPAYAFPLFFPKRIASSVSEKNFSLGQLAYNIRFGKNEDAFGILFSSEGILSSDIANYMPSTKPTSTLVAKMINPAILLANCYLHGKYSDCSILLKSGNSKSDVLITGDYADGFLRAKKLSYNVLKKYFRKYGAYTIPGSLKISNLGSDGHFVGSIPMMNGKSKSNDLTSDINGQINGLDGVYAVDGSSIPVLPPKHPSYAIMANADRIGQNIVSELKL